MCGKEGREGEGAGGRGGDAQHVQVQMTLFESLSSLCSVLSEQLHSITGGGWPASETDGHAEWDA